MDATARLGSGTNPQEEKHHLAKVRVAGSNPVFRSYRNSCPLFADEHLAQTDLLGMREFDVSEEKHPNGRRRLGESYGHRHRVGRLDQTQTSAPNAGTKSRDFSVIIVKAPCLPIRVWTSRGRSLSFARS